MFLKLILVACLVLHSLSIFRKGKCFTNRSQLTTFNPSLLVGRWYEVARTRDFPHEVGECNVIEYSTSIDGFDTIVSEVRNNTLVSAAGKLLKTGNPLQYIMTIPIAQFRDNLYIIDTDYNSYGVVYTCSGSGNTKREYVWITSRTPSIDQTKFDSLVNMIRKEFGILKKDLHITFQGPSLCNIR
jgi:lipocalin